jgi:hypothetical protein
MTVAGVKVTAPGKISNSPLMRSVPVDLTF